MAMRIYLDCETLPPDRDNRDPLPIERFAQYTDEEFRQLALDARHGRLLCIGLIIEQDGKTTVHGVLGRDRTTGQFHLDERRTLRAFWKLVRDFDQRRDILIGFNLLDFDLVFLCQRSIIKQVKPSINVCFARYRSQPVYDLMWEFSKWRYRHKLDDLAKVLGLESSKQDRLDGSKVYDYFLAGRHQEIADYCLRDVEVARAIYLRMNFLDET
jgi:hypothetical protein